MVDPRCLPPDTLKALAAERLGQHAPPPHSARSLRESAEAAMSAAVTACSPPSQRRPISAAWGGGGLSWLMRSSRLGVTARP